jgi:hypothetical protein
VGASVPPWGRAPVRIAAITWSSVHDPMPVVGSGVMFGARHTPLPPGPGASNPPANSFVVSGVPDALIGV